MSARPPFVSIALCTYNGDRYLERQLDSLLTQTYSHFEIVAVDDASSDATQRILQRYADADSRIQWTSNAENLGFKRNFARALTLCRGDLIAPCDQDDIWLPQKLATLVAALGERQLAYCDSTLVDEAGEPIGSRMSDIVRATTTDDPVPFAFGNCVSGHAMLFRRGLLEVALPIPEDFFHDWWIAAVAAAAGGIVFHPESLVLYRQHGANVTDQRLKEMMVDAGARVAPVAAPKLRGAGLQYFLATERRLAAIARLPGPHQSFAARLHSSWRRRERQWFSPGLARLMIQHRHRLLRFANLSEKKTRRYLRDLFYGLRLKRLMGSRAYTTTMNA